jgi:hypothetical protein
MGLNMFLYDVIEAFVHTNQVGYKTKKVNTNNDDSFK